MGITITSSLVTYDKGYFIDDYKVDDEPRNYRGFLFALIIEEPSRSIKRLELLPVEIDNFTPFNDPKKPLRNESLIECKNYPMNYRLTLLENKIG